MTARKKEKEIQKAQHLEFMTPLDATQQQHNMQMKVFQHQQQQQQQQFLMSQQQWMLIM